MALQEATKSPQAFRTISEASSELGVPQHVLRFWETKFSFIRPMKRAGGRRFYRPQDLAVLKGVRTLLHDEGYTIKGVQRLHKEEGMRRLVGAGGAEGQTIGVDILMALEAEAALPDVAGDHLEDREEPLIESSSAPQAEPDAVGILRTGARSRLEVVLRDIESAKAAVDRLLAESDG